MAKHHMKAQSSTELLIILSVTLVIVSIMVVLNFDLITVANQRFKATQAQDALNDIARSSQLVYQEGNGAMTKIYLHIPSQISGTRVFNRTISISSIISGSNVTFFRNLDFNVSGTIPSTEGYYWVNITSRGNYVQIG